MNCEHMVALAEIAMAARMLSIFCFLIGGSIFVFGCLYLLVKK